MKSFLCCLALASILTISVLNNSFSFELIEPHPDSVTVESLTNRFGYHLYGTQGSEFDISTYYPTFDGLFNLYVSDQIAAWDSSSIATLLLYIVDSDSANTADIFPKVWDYFCDGDSNSSYYGIRFTPDGGATHYTKIDIYIYDKDDFTSCGTCFFENSGYSWYLGYSNDMILSATDSEDEIDQLAFEGFAHELQHLCYCVNGLFPDEYYSVNETFSNAAQHLVKAYQYDSLKYDISYDTSIFRGERCEPNRKYLYEEIWGGYLLDVGDNDNTDITDDLVYRWTRYMSDSSREITMNSLADILADSDFAWLGGLTGDIRLQNFFQNFLIAKYCNAHNFKSYDRFGFSSTYNPTEDRGLFLDICSWTPNGSSPVLPYDCVQNCEQDFTFGACEGCPLINDQQWWACGSTGCWNVRILPPDYMLGSAHHNVMAVVDSYYTDSDGSKDTIDVAVYGTDYVIFRADTFYQDNDYHELHFRLEGENTTPSSGKEVKMWVIGYDSTEDTLQVHPEDIAFIESSHIDPDSTSRDVVVGDFGNSIKSVVIAITYLETTASSGYDNDYTWVDGDYYAYQYEYGVYTPDSQDVDWKGDVFVNGDVEIGDDMTLTIYPGTNITVPTNSESADEDRIDALTAGEVFIEGTATDKIKFKSDNASPSVGDWDGIRFASGVSKITILHTEIYHADTAIESDTITYLNCCFIDSTNAEAFDIGNNASIDSSTIYLNSDHIIESGDTFSVTGNTTFYIGTEDLAEHWNDTTLVEFWNFGVLDINGDSGDKVEFKSTSASTYGGDWMGIKPADSTVTTTIRDCVISDAVYGIKSSVTVTLRNVNIKNSAVTGIYLYEDENTGVEGNESTLDSCTFSYNDSTDATGMQIWNCDSTIVVDSCEVNYNGGYGMWVSNASPDITCTDIQNNGNDGIHMGRYQSAEIWEPYIYKCKVQYNGDDGLYFYRCKGDVQLTLVSDNETNGAYCFGLYGDPNFKSSKIIDNPTGIKARFAEPVVGDDNDPTSTGNNILDNDTYNLHNSGEILLPTIKAENCWWGESPPDTDKMVGNVDYTPWLTSEPLLQFSIGVHEDSQIPTRVMLYQNFPNPLVGGNSTQIKFSLPKAENVSITVYDVAGRKVRTLASGVKQPGYHYIRWDGHNDKGARVATGIYFYQMKVGSKVMSKKIVLIR